MLLETVLAVWGQTILSDNRSIPIRDRQGKVYSTNSNPCRLEKSQPRIDWCSNHSIPHREYLNCMLSYIRIGINRGRHLLHIPPDNDQNRLCELTCLSSVQINMSSDSLQETAANTILSDSSSGIVKDYVTNTSSARLSTVANILTQRFGNNWKMILILILGLFVIAIVIIVLF